MNILSSTPQTELWLGLAVTNGNEGYVRCGIDEVDRSDAISDVLSIHGGCTRAESIGVTISKLEEEGLVRDSGVTTHVARVEFSSENETRFSIFLRQEN